MDELAMQGLSRLQQMELQEECGEGVRILTLPPVGFHSLEGRAGRMVVALSYPAMRALAEIVSRDRATVDYQIQRAGGAVEEGVVDWDSATESVRASGPELAALISEVSQGSGPE
jgi:hypothetical protein